MQNLSAIKSHLRALAGAILKWYNLLRRNGSQWGFRVIETLVWSTLERTMDAIVQRGGSNAAKVVKSMPTKLLKGLPPCKQRIDYAKWLLSLCEKHGITQQMLEK